MTQNSEQELQTPSTYIHMGFDTFVVDIYCVRFFFQPVGYLLQMITT